MAPAGRIRIVLLSAQSSSENASPETGDTSVTHKTGAKHEASATDETIPISHMTPDPSHTCDTILLIPVASA